MKNKIVMMMAAMMVCASFVSCDSETVTAGIYTDKQSMIALNGMTLPPLTNTE